MIEMLAVLVVLGIIGAFSTSMLRSDRMAVQQAATILAGQVSRTRLEAIKNNEDTGIWFTGGYTLATDANGNSTYSLDSGSYKICVDTNRDAACSGSEKIVHSLQFGTGNLAKVNILSAGSNGVIFDSRGVPKQGDVYLFVSNKDWSKYRLIYINAQGRASVL